MKPFKNELRQIPVFHCKNKQLETSQVVSALVAKCSPNQTEKQKQNQRTFAPPVPALSPGLVALAALAAFVPLA